MGLEAGVAQSVEQLIRNEKVEGSIPFSGTNQIKHLASDALRGFVVFGIHVAKCAGFLQEAQAMHHQPRLPALATSRGDPNSCARRGLLNWLRMTAAQLCTGACRVTAR